MTMNKAEARRTIKSLNAVGSPADRRVRPPRKATLDRLCRVLDEWRREEQSLCSHYGPPDGLPVGCTRIKRIKDAEALQQALAYLLAKQSCQCGLTTEG
jgi:hypothetical protein